MATKRSTNCRKSAIVAVCVLYLILGAGVFSISQYTLVRFEMPLICSMALALISGSVFWKLKIWVWLTGSTKFLPNYLCHSISVFRRV